MNRISWGKIKFIILCILIATSLVQVGILWNYQSHGFPTFFLMRHPVSAAQDIENSKIYYFTPFRIVVSEGYGSSSHWILSSDSDIYKGIWADAQLCIKQALKSKISKNAAAFKEEDWGKLILKKKGYIIEFNTNIKLDMVKWLLGVTDNLSDSPSGIYKMILVPSDVDNNGMDTLYIRDDAKIYTYTFSAFDSNVKRLTRDDLDKVISDFDNSDSIPVYSIPAYTTSVPYTIAQDVLMALAGPKYKKLHELSYAVPDIGIRNSYTDIADLNIVADKVLGNERGSFDPDQDNGIAIFKNSSSIYRVFNSGEIEYKYLTLDEGADKGSVGDAFKQTLQFINRRMLDKNGRNQLLSPGVNIYLSGIKESDKDAYTFTFDYLYSFGGNAGDLPIYIKDYRLLSTGKKVNNAITIRANGKRVINCNWILKKFDSTKVAYGYNIRFFDIMDKFVDSYVDWKEKGFIGDVNLSYKIDSWAEKTKNIEPECMIVTSTGNYPVKLDKKPLN